MEKITESGEPQPEGVCGDGEPQPEGVWGGDDDEGEEDNESEEGVPLLSSNAGMCVVVAVAARGPHCSSHPGPRQPAILPSRRQEAVVRD